MDEFGNETAIQKEKLQETQNKLNVLWGNLVRVGDFIFRYKRREFALIHLFRVKELAI
jgi:hypothetical protein